MAQFGYQVLGFGGGEDAPFYTAHTFLTTANWVCSAGGTVDILVVGGGGSGGVGS